MSERDNYLAEMIRVDGRGDVGDMCSGCGTAPGLV
jgi:tRNA1(Val) A37 N6-methylase TrmN6